jgi:cell wall-associated NlpC family hydrolase
MIRTATGFDRFAARQRQVLALTAQRVGMPYVWGGELDRPGTLGGRQPVGGFDCSGLVWRVFKLSGMPEGRRIRGRTAAQQAGEIPRRARIARAEVRPADLLFFGSARPWQRATERNTTHEGIALSDTWMLHASSAQGGVAALRIDARDFSWARRVL